MTGQGRNRTASRIALAAVVALTAVLTLACGQDYYEIAIETPIQPKLDVSPVQRVLVAGFVSGGSDDVDANLETVRLLRSQLRTKSSLRVIDADVMSLNEIAQDQSKPAGTNDATSSEQASAAASTDPTALPKNIKEEKDLEPYERLFANTSYWKNIGEEYQNPLIVTGTVLFAPKTSSGFVNREVEEFDGLGRRRVTPLRQYQERKGFVLRPKFVFIDGRTGATMYSETFREEILYPSQQNMPALSSYFELMDRLVPSFLSALSSQKIKGTRVLLN